MFEALNRLAKEIAGLKQAMAAVLSLRQVTVTAVHAGPPKTVDITIGGNAVTGVRYLNAYAPTNGDTAWLFRNGADLIVIDKLA